MPITVGGFLLYSGKTISMYKTEYLSAIAMLVSVSGFVATEHAKLDTHFWFHVYYKS